MAKRRRPAEGAGFNRVGDEDWIAENLQEHIAIARGRDQCRIKV